MTLVFLLLSYQVLRQLLDGNSEAMVIATLALVWKLKASRFSAAGLIIAGMLVLPYSSSTSAITPLAVGVIPLAHQRPAGGLLLFGLYNGLFLFLGAAELCSAWEAVYWTGVLLTCWAVLFWRECKLNPSRPAANSDGTSVDATAAPAS